MKDIDLEHVTGGAPKYPVYKPVNHGPGWTEQQKRAHGELYYREVSPSGRPGRWHIVDTFWAVPHD